MKVLYPSERPQERVEVVQRIPIRSSIMAPDGTVIRVPINPAAPDSHTIIATLQFVVDQFGRDPRVRQKALTLVSSIANNDVERNARTIFRWVVNRMVYLADPDGGEFVQTPIVLLRQIADKGNAYGDCDDHVVLLGALLVSIGIPAEVVGVKIFGSPYYNHVVIQFLHNGRMITMDPCAKNAPPPQYGERLVAR